VNIIGNLGDPAKVAEALKPLIEQAEDKALAELHASFVVAVTALQQDVAQALDTIQREIQDTRIVMVEQVQVLGTIATRLVQTFVQEIQKTTIQLGRVETKQS